MPDRPLEDVNAITTRQSGRIDESIDVAMLVVNRPPERLSRREMPGAHGVRRRPDIHATGITNIEETNARSA